MSPFLSNGSHIRGLYPTLAFLDRSWPVLICICRTSCRDSDVVPFDALSFLRLDYTNAVKLPNDQIMWAWHEKTIQERGGYGKPLFIGLEVF